MTDYNVQCIACGSAWAAVPKSSQWWRAKQRDEKGFLDAVTVAGEECGCIKRVVDPDAPYRVFGSNDLGEEFNQPFISFTKAVKTFMKLKKDNFLDVWILGVSDPVERRLMNISIFD